jgi:hypothetical protein
MLKTHHTDRAAKDILRCQWPVSTALWNEVGDKAKRWLKSQPVTNGPRLASPGSKMFHTQPDGLWVRLFVGHNEVYCDVITIEVCGTLQNFSDKRARYMHSTAALVLRCPKNWMRSLNDNVMKKAGFSAKPESGMSFPVRHMRILYSLPSASYDRWKENGVLAAHEFLCLHSSLSSFTSQKMQIFLKQLSPSSSFYTG